jgi:hypothetical protein
MRAHWLIVVMIAGCGLGAGEGGGSENLPTAGAGPYGKLFDFDFATPAEEPYVVTERDVHLADPSALLVATGFRVWFTHTPVDPADGGPEIWVADLSDLAELPSGSPLRVLGAGEPWEEGAVRAPSVSSPDGETLVMFYQGGAATPAIGRATSTDGGLSWEKQGQVLAGAIDPSALHVDGHWFLYFGRPDAHGIFVAESDDGGASFVAQQEPVVQRRDTRVDVFDRLWVGEPAAVGGVTVAGQLRVGLFYVGKATDGTFAIGHAASADGLEFARFNLGEAILDPEGTDERGPSAIVVSTQGFLFFAQRRVSTWAIAAAVSP